MNAVIIESLRKIPDVHIARAELLRTLSSARNLESRDSCEEFINMYVSFCKQPTEIRLGNGSIRLLETGLKKANYFSTNTEEDTFI